MSIPGDEIRELCEKLGVAPENVHRIEIEPRSVLIVHEVRRGDHGMFLRGDRSDALRRITEIRIDWSAGDE